MLIVTLPNIPQVQSSHANTRGVAALDTKTDVNAPTLVTVDSVPTSPPSRACHRSPFRYPKPRHFHQARLAAMPSPTWAPA